MRPPSVPPEVWYPLADAADFLRYYLDTGRPHYLAEFYKAVERAHR